MLRAGASTTMSLETERVRPSHPQEPTRERDISIKTNQQASAPKWATPLFCAAMTVGVRCAVLAARPSYQTTQYILRSHDSTDLGPALIGSVSNSIVVWYSQSTTLFSAVM